VRKSVLGGTIVTLPLVLIAGREAGRLVAGFSDPRRSSGAPLLWIFGILTTLVLLWTGVALVGKAQKGNRDPSRLPFAATAAIASAEARKRPPAEKCPACGRPRLIQDAVRCLYCGAPWQSVVPGASPPA
jgi:hypothetical protein